MTQITSIKLGLIAICFATVPLSQAQMPRTRTSGSNPIAASTGAMIGHSGLSGNSTSVGQLGTNFRSSTITAPNTNIRGRIGTNAGAQIGISNPNGGMITGGAAGGLGSSSGNSTGAAQLGINARSGTNTTASANAGARTAAAATTRASVNIIQPQLIPVPTRSALPNNSPIGSNFSTAGESPSPVPSASVTPTPTPTPAQSL